MKKIGLILLFSASTFAAHFAAADIIPVLDVAPEYPQAALRRDVSGHVIVRFDVNENGKAHNITIVNANPERIFNDAVRTALKRSTFSVTDGASSSSFERTYYFDQAANNNMANRFNFMEEAPSLASN
jgi:TonB family protein